MPQIPVTETSCTNGRSPYWLLARELIVPVGPKDGHVLEAHQGDGEDEGPGKARAPGGPRAGQRHMAASPPR